ncbi:MAG: glycosyltransferase family 2 protein [Reyranella sp.]|nr:glycosyltransferase family 2 protein [Reyranella sp.]
MQTSGTLALLIPAYNAAGFLPRLLGGAASQTRAFDEIWVYDDCSTDDTAGVAAALGAKVFRGDVNRGCSFGKNALTNLTSCEWVHFHDADDELHPEFVERAHVWMKEDAHDVIVFESIERDEKTGAYGEETKHVSALLSEDPVKYTIHTKINAICGLYRRSAFLAAGGFDTDPAVLYNEDVAMHCSLARAGLRFSADPTVLMVYWRREGSMSNANQARCFRAQYQVMLKAKAHDVQMKYRADIAGQLWHVAAASASYLDWENADASARLAFQLAGMPHSQSGLFRALCRLEPSIALRVREWFIRLVKPRYRVGYPGWRLR